MQNKPVVKRSESYIEKNHTEKVPKKKNQSSVSLQNSLDFLLEHNKIFHKTLYSCGDADTFFKKSLRSYNHIDTTPYPGTLKLIKSLDTLDGALEKKRKKNLKHKPKPAAVIENIEKERPQSPESVDIFYSPGSSNRSFTSSPALSVKTLKAPSNRSFESTPYSHFHSINKSNKSRASSQESLFHTNLPQKMAEDEEFVGDITDEEEAEMEALAAEKAAAIAEEASPDSPVAAEGELDGEEVSYSNHAKIFQRENFSCY